MLPQKAIAGALAFGVASALDSGLAQLPPMGFNSWYAVASEVTEKFMKDNVAVLLKSGLAEKGYRYVNVDEGWMKGRNETTGMFYEDLTMFPNGMKAFGDWVHDQGLLYGLYTSRGICQCSTGAYDRRAVPSNRSGNNPEGSNGFEEQDAKFFADAGADFIKEDSCCGSQDHAVAYGDYARMRDALNRTGRPMVFSLCGWAPWYAPVGISLAHTWRISGDGNNWNAHLDGINKMAAIAQWTGPGGWNDPDFLMGPAGAPAVGGQTEAQSRAQMSLWCVFPAPLFISMDLTKASESLMGIWGNREAIAVNQDSAARAGTRLVGGDLSRSDGSTNVWAKQLANGDWAVVFVNSGPDATDIVCDKATCMSQMGLADVGARLHLRDIWARTDNGTVDADEGLIMKDVPGDAGVVFLRVTPIFMEHTPPAPPAPYAPNGTFVPSSNGNRDLEFSNGASVSGGPKDDKCSGSNVRTGGAGDHSKVAIRHWLLGFGHNISRVRLSFRYVAGYTPPSGQKKKGSVARLVLLRNVTEDLLANCERASCPAEAIENGIVATLFTSDPLIDYSYDHFTSYSPPISVDVAGLAIPNSEPLQLAFLFDNNDRNLQIPMDDLESGWNVTIFWDGDIAASFADNNWALV